MKPISFDESEFLRWNSDPFDLDGGDGGSETDPGENDAFDVYRYHMFLTLVYYQVISYFHIGWQGNFPYSHTFSEYLSAPRYYKLL